MFHNCGSLAGSNSNSFNYKGGSGDPTVTFPSWFRGFGHRDPRLGGLR